MTVFSVLDQGPIRREGGARQALHDTVAAARAVDELGFARYWVAEHHGTASRAIAAPELVIGPVAAATRRMRVGSGGVLLTNHTPLHLAEQFRTLEALHPQRIDLGVGRSSGTIDAASAAALARGDEDAFAGPLRTLLAVRHGAGPVAMPDDVALPPVFLLGSSGASAETAAALGLPYAVSAGFRDPDLANGAIARYRAKFAGERSYAILVVRAWVGADDADGERLAASERLANVQQLAGDPQPLISPDEALAHPYTGAERTVSAGLDLRSDVAGGAAYARDRLRAAAKESGADEVMVVSNTWSVEDRIASFRRLSAALELA